MAKMNQSKLRNLIDSLTFPIRALFMAREGKFGLLSLREERMGLVARFSRGRVLDVGCGPGNLFIKKFIGEENGLGIDVFPYEGVINVIKDLTRIPFEDSSFETITLIAVGGHIPKSKRRAEFAEFIRLLKPGGQLLMTEGEPISQFLIHQWEKFYLGLFGQKGLDSERGMDEEEEYCLARPEILEYLNIPPLKLVKRVRFMWGLNNLYIAEKEK